MYILFSFLGLVLILSVGCTRLVRYIFQESECVSVIPVRS